MRYVLRILLAFLLVSPALGITARAAEPPAAARPASLAAPARIDQMVGESLTYDIGFLWFHRLAEGRLSFRRGKRPGTYEAVLEAKTRGIAAWLTGDRDQRYVSEMTVGADGRLKSLVHEADMLKGKGRNRKDRVKRYIFDYADHLVRQQVVRNGKAEKEKTFPQGKNPPNDILTAFYNFRAGFYGPLVPGRRYRIPAFGRTKPSAIVIHLLDKNQRVKKGFFPKGGFLAKVRVDPEVFDTGGGSVYIWFNKLRQPVLGIVENVIGMGDVKGRLRHRTTARTRAENGKAKNREMAF